MPGIIVSDTSCLILLNKLGKLHLLKSLFREITITKIIAEEFDENLPDFIMIKNPVNAEYQRILENALDKGEASAFALCIEHPDSLLIVDDYKARKEADRLQIKFTGTMGILLLAKEKGFLNSLKEIIDLISGTNFRLSKKLVSEILAKAGEK